MQHTNKQFKLVTLKTRGYIATNEILTMFQCAQVFFYFKGCIFLIAWNISLPVSFRSDSFKS